jgi:hypothetical protein
MMPAWVVEPRAHLPKRNPMGNNVLGSHGMRAIHRGMPFLSSFLFGFMASAITTLVVCEITPARPLPPWLLKRPLPPERGSTGVRF